MTATPTNKLITWHGCRGGHKSCRNPDPRMCSVIFAWISMLSWMPCQQRHEVKSDVKAQKTFVHTYARTKECRFRWWCGNIIGLLQFWVDVAKVKEKCKLNMWGVTLLYDECLTSSVLTKSNQLLYNPYLPHPRTRINSIPSIPTKSNSNPNLPSTRTHICGVLRKLGVADFLVDDKITSSISSNCLLPSQNQCSWGDRYPKRGNPEIHTFRTTRDAATHTAMPAES